MTAVEQPSEASAGQAIESAEGTVAEKKLGWGFWLAIAWLVLIIGLAALAPWLPLKDPDANFVDIQGKGRPPYSPSGDHWMLCNGRLCWNPQVRWQCIGEHTGGCRLQTLFSSSRSIGNFPDPFCTASPARSGHWNR